MTYFADLSPYSYWPTGGENAVNVGWLDGAHEFPTGEVPEGVVSALLRLALKDMVNRTRGFHRCELCTEPDYPVKMEVDGQELALGSAEVRVKGTDGTVYAAPTLIAHYISEHGYRPPAPFVEALLEPGAGG